MRPEEYDWSKHYPAYYRAQDGAEQKVVEFADIGKGRMRSTSGSRCAVLCTKSRKSQDAVMGVC